MAGFNKVGGWVALRAYVTAMRSAIRSSVGCVSARNWEREGSLGACLTAEDVKEVAITMSEINLRAQNSNGRGPIVGSAIQLWQNRSDEEL